MPAPKDKSVLPRHLEEACLNFLAEGLGLDSEGRALSRMLEEKRESSLPPITKNEKTASTERFGPK